MSFTPTERRTLERANVVDPEASKFFLSAPSAFRSWFVTNMVPGGAPSRREDVKESLKWWENNIKGGKKKEVLYESDTVRYYIDGTSEPK